MNQEAQTIILALIGQSGIIAGAWFTFRGALAKIKADVQVTKSDVKVTKEAAVKTEDSINNRPTSLSHRLDEWRKEDNERHEAVVGVLNEHKTELRDLKDNQHLAHQTATQLRADMLVQQQTLSAHIRESGQNHLIPLKEG